MKVFATTHDFAYSWAEVSTANWRKYCPWNRESTHVIAVDTLSRSFDPKTCLLRTERLITCKQTTPKWISSLLGGQDTSHVYEISYVTPPSADVEEVRKVEMDRLPGVGEAGLDGEGRIRVPSASALPSPPGHEGPRNPSVTMVSYNLTWADLLSVRETVTYTPSPVDPKGMTRFEQNATITSFAGGWQKIKDKIEAATVERFGQNAAKGRIGFEEVLEMSRRAFADERQNDKLRRDLGAKGQGARVAARG